MATETVLKELFEVSQQSVLFRGMTAANIWNACLSHSDRSDDDVRKAIENIHKRDREAEQKAIESQKSIEKGKEKIIALREEEAGDRVMDSQNAEAILENLFQ